MLLHLHGVSSFMHVGTKLDALGHDRPGFLKGDFVEADFLLVLSNQPKACFGDKHLLDILAGSLRMGQVIGQDVGFNKYSNQNLEQPFRAFGAVVARLIKVYPWGLRLVFELKNS